MAYQFTDTIEAGERSASMSIQTIFNKVNLDAVLTDENGSFTTLTVSDRRNTTNRINTLGIQGMHGVHEEDYTTVEPRQPRVKFRIQDKSNEGFAKRLTRLNRLLKGVKRELSFADEPYIFYATLSELEIPEEETNDLIGFITFYCSDPFKYGSEHGYNMNDEYTVNNDGSVEADPIIELTANKKATFAMVTNHEDNYNMIGMPVDDDIEMVDTRNRVLYEAGKSLNTWQTAKISAFPRKWDVQKIDGVMTTDDAGIRANGYGTGDKRHGPAIIKEITPIQDFEIESTFDIISKRKEESWRMGIVFFDENMNQLGHIGVKDNRKNEMVRTPLARYGPYRGGGRSNGNMIGDTRLFDPARETTLFYLRMSRVGNKYTFYIGEWQNHKHKRKYQETYIDEDLEFNGKLKYISLYISSFQDRRTPSRLRINSVEVTELLSAKEDQTPYIIYPDDIVLFDHKNEDILINGEARNDLKDFGGQFFKLSEGLNHLTISPEATFDATLRYKPKHL